MNNMMPPPQKNNDIGLGRAIKMLKKTFGYLSGSTKMIVLMFVFISFSTVLNLMIPHLIERSIDSIVGPAPGVRDLSFYLIVLFAVFAFSFVFSFLQGRLSAKLTKVTTLDIRKDVSEKLIRLPVSFFDNHTSGDIMSRLTNDIENVSNMISQSVGAILASVIVIVGCAVIMFVKNPLLALICLSTVILNVLVTTVLSRRMFGLFRVQQKTVGEMNAVVEQSISSKKTVDCCGMTGDVIDDHAKISDSLTSVGIKAQLLGGAMAPLMSCRTASL